jgi:hypothetical protein
MLTMGLVAVYQRPKTTAPNPEHKIRSHLLRDMKIGSEARAEIGRWIDYYNAAGPHSAHGGRTPNEAYQRQPDDQKSAA